MIEYKEPTHWVVDARDTVTLNELGLVPFTPVSSDQRLRPGSAIAIVAPGNAAGGR